MLSGLDSNWEFSLGVELGLGSRVLRFLGEEVWGFFLAAAARAPDMRASKAEGREDMARLGFGEIGKREEWLRRRRERSVECRRIQEEDARSGCESIEGKESGGQGFWGQRPSLGTTRVLGLINGGKHQG